MRISFPIFPRNLLAPLALSACLFAQQDGGPEPARAIALVGGTVLDVSAFGRSTPHDIRNATVLLRDGKIAAAGPRASISIPANARVIDVSGKFILPGFIDGFTGVNSQAQASAHLYMGVTTVVASQDDRRGRLFLHPDPGPHIYLLDSVGSTDEFNLLAGQPEWATILKGHDPDVELSWDQTSRMIDEQMSLGVRALWLGHNLTAANVTRILAKAAEKGLPTFGEFIATPYSGPIQSGISLLLHMSRYELGLLPPADPLITALAADPEGPAARKAYQTASSSDPAGPAVEHFVSSLKAKRVALMPTFSLFYTQLPGHRNLWKDPIAATLDPHDMFQPTARDTGEPAYPSPQARAFLERLAAQLWELNRAFAARHPLYLAATGSAVFGSMPGISMHTELELLVRAGLTPREALAAATSNYAELFHWRELGLVAPGRRGDLVVLDADPTLDIRNSSRIALVLLDGAVVDREALLKGSPVAGLTAGSTLRCSLR